MRKRVKTPCRFKIYGNVKRMYSERGDPYDHIIEDVGNMRPLTDDQMAFLVQRPRPDLIGVILSMNRSLELLTQCVNGSQLKSLRQTTQNFSRLVSEKVREARMRDFESMIAADLPEAKEPEPVKKEESNDSIRALLKCKQG